ncbi:hypothetical protein [Humisphaera borealis]|uniref:Uncharacterized protein n=1 Tax=Humisphaera borealis TaxID=2807512 RepID=A0A7M2X3T4_9BACT|nr:hypothetical protein [Humisphaera borealis]QOV91681.1 hypothetical protein IPV69_10080 [Humisphaera borealis]
MAMLTPPLDLRVLAQFASDAIHFELLDPANVIVWADSLIAESDIPPPWLIDLSLVDPSDSLAVRAALRAVPGEPDVDQSDRLLNSLVLREWQRGKLTTQRICTIGWQLYTRDPDRRELTQWGVVVDHSGEQLDDGCISKETMRETIDQELVPFADDVPRLPPWA